MTYGGWYKRSEWSQWQLVSIRLSTAAQKPATGRRNALLKTGGLRLA
jgi:hypothetical protein